jgi:hypothetical protein
MNKRLWVVHVAKITPIVKKDCTTSGQSLSSCMRVIDPNPETIIVYVLKNRYLESFIEGTLVVFSNLKKSV